MYGIYFILLVCLILKQLVGEGGIRLWKEKRKGKMCRPIATYTRIQVLSLDAGKAQGWSSAPAHNSELTVEFGVRWDECESENCRKKEENRENLLSKLQRAFNRSSPKSASCTIGLIIPRQEPYHVFGFSWPACRGRLPCRVKENYIFFFKQMKERKYKQDFSPIFIVAITCWLFSTIFFIIFMVTIPRHYILLMNLDWI